MGDRTHNGLERRKKTDEQEERKKTWATECTMDWRRKKPEEKEERRKTSPTKRTMDEKKEKKQVQLKKIKNKLKTTGNKKQAKINV